MNQELVQVFISYSWDSPNHQQWVLNLTNRLRSQGGVDAKMDLFITQSGTVNLNSMMVQNMMRNSFIIVVLTENYADRADNNKGGVGFETLLSLSTLQDNPNKLILLNRHGGDFKAAIPFHLKGYYMIDFSEDSKFEESFTELLHRIYDVPLYEMEPIGSRPTLTSRKSGLNISEQSVVKDTFYEEIVRPHIIEYSDIDKMRFIEQSYADINLELTHLFSDIKKHKSNFEYDCQKITEKKMVFELFKGGRSMTNVKIWIGSMFGSLPQINLAFGARDYDNDNSMNQSISWTLTEEKQLALEMTLSIGGNRGPHDSRGIVQEIWEQHLKYLFT
ncbi:toll/interleukin-1 receptor domain-containing protein [Paenibacillus sp. BC26]|uniref:toll/interleukin-1 receptor domain-containing protein n=1 Tax=Paenibacillus sp. BC26 TaxID=1881032 RepID=UPI0008E4ECD8|nr:toll/interleukin-1 receptor domain-containing protein [Paenibacillus sp. BC26]SFS77701.1 SEFIR domain-containing protein [Paenibacillus sp. BC26]